MQKTERSFLVSLLLSFLFAFSVAAYLSSPFTIRVQTVTADAEEVEEVATTTPAIPFSFLNIISLIEVPTELSFATSTPPTASTSVATVVSKPASAEKPAPKKVVKQTARPVRLIIPSIGLNTSVDHVGLNSVGEMAVPDGSSPNVGWYKYGTIPGNVGSAVIDAHVYAAFKELRYVKVGESIFVENADGTRLEFKVQDSRVYKLGELTSNMLFGKRDARRLNLITCAGQPVGDTYSHRLVVYTTLVT